MFDTQPKLYLRKDIIDQFNSSGLFTHYRKPNSIEQNIYLVQNCENLTISWKANHQNYDLKSTDIFDETDKKCSIKVRPIENNVDNVKLIIGSQLFYKYCLFLDYKNSEIGLSISNTM